MAKKVMNKKDEIMGFLGILRRAGKITVGTDPVCDSVAKGKAKLVLMTNTVSDNTKKVILKTVKAYSMPAYIINYSRDDVSYAIGKLAVVLSINDEKAALSLKSKLGDDMEECTHDHKIQAK
ncbi:MAG: ribosomal L7Ae/L30e/S12e/Gadd45 family protein [Clostridia bacterium]|nr:ribosomal L7Ae/L30e/S12e/Gadd45 family protein [Clostridia bacterium]